MRVERAGLEEAAGVMELIRRCKEDMRSQGIFQWDEIYPNLGVIENDARVGSLFVIREGDECVAAVCLNDVEAPEYASVSWRYSRGPVLVVHRLCVDPGRQGRGLARMLMDFAERLAAERGCASIRLDTYTGNPRAMALYERRGYERAGQVYFRGRPLPFDCFEKVVRS
jgi:GNAT superfamily N-acetyltransferase